MIEATLAVIGVFGTILATWLTLRSQANQDALEHGVAMAELQEQIRQALLREIHEELEREKEKRKELEARVEHLEKENQMLVVEREARIRLEERGRALEARVQALEAENADLKRRLTAQEK